MLSPARQPWALSGFRSIQLVTYHAPQLDLSGGLLAVKLHLPDAQLVAFPTLASTLGCGPAPIPLRPLTLCPLKSRHLCLGSLSRLALRGY